jgi:hypothetical protein
MIDLASTHPNLSENGVRIVNELSDRADAALATPAVEPPTDEGLQKSEVYNEEFWRKHALEQLLHASTSYRLGVYSSEELELYEKRARFFLDRWFQAKPPEPPTVEEIDRCIEHWKELCNYPTTRDRFKWAYLLDRDDILNAVRAILERWG